MALGYTLTYCARVDCSYRLSHHPTSIIKTTGWLPTSYAAKGGLELLIYLTSDVMAGMSHCTANLIVGGGWNPGLPG